MIDIIYQDHDLIAINKPHGLLVHRSPIASDATEFAVQILRDQIGQRVYPVHRLDRKTSGVLLFALNTEVDVNLQMQFQERKVSKTYHTILRGYTEDKGTIDYPLRRDDGKIQEAITHYETICRAEVPVPFGKHETSRYSLIEAKPETGRMHQLRKHFKHILHPIIGDRAHGCNKQNKFFKETWNMTTMMLHATELRVNHPKTNNELILRAGLHEEFERTLKFLTLNFPPVLID